MSFKEWLLGTYPNPAIDGRYGTLHIITLVVCIAVMIISSLLLKNKSMQCKRAVLVTYAAVILFFEIARRLVNLYKLESCDSFSLMHTLLPRPGCAISCWLIIISAVVNKRAVYNVTAIIALLCGFAFFVHPGAGFNNEYMLFENVYSIITHSLLFTASVCCLTYGFTKFTLRGIWKDLLLLGVISGYVYWEICISGIEHDPFYFMPGNEVQEMLGMSYEPFLLCYIALMIVYFSAFYIIQNAIDKRSKIDVNVKRTFFVNR